MDPISAIAIIGGFRLVQYYKDGSREELRLPRVVKLNADQRRQIIAIVRQGQPQDVPEYLADRHFTAQA